MKSKIKLALCQISSKRENKEANFAQFEELMFKAKEQGADLAIFPEMSLTGYILHDQVYEQAEPIPGPSVQKVEELSKKTGVYAIFGMPELSGKTQATLYNTAVFVGPEGYIGKYRKMYLPTHSVFEEKRYFRPGYEPAAFQTSIGNIGLTICYDVFFPEVFRLPRLKGAQLIVCISASPAVRRGYFEILTAARALENTAYVAYVNLTGVEDGLQFWGGSRLVSPTGDVLAKAKYNERDFVVCEVDFSDLRMAETFIPTLRDLRPELYDKLKQFSEEI
ncbi:carbon-nitrogen hydrolase family protein [Candidatus Bathycorpusculum sp.]|uniref:carbon-nitrogen hydrolase family protein n=1 Tax=Candidatus Bathycorpusculum sp. TaxID=2994959 RepID=UPI0028355159|nr:carbon-nitrogen hydrolase family protein [Candidatus Termitimicrobium sp.]MCL2431363.1 carbon-nitrogen hydrolase family protein [Candidatus Termitimicrobium sp.]